MNGYDRAFYSDVERLRNAQERLALIETGRYCRELLARTDLDGAVRARVLLRLEEADDRIFGLATLPGESPVALKAAAART